MDGLPALPWASIGPVGLLTIVVVLILLGRLIPWGTWSAWQATWNQRLADAEADNAKLHDIIKDQQRTLEVYNSQLKQLLDAMKAIEQPSLNNREVTRRGVVEAENQAG